MAEGADNLVLNDEDQLVLDLITASSAFDEAQASVLVSWWRQASKGESGLLRFLESKGVLSPQANHLVSAVLNGHLKKANVRVFLTAQGMSRLKIFLETVRVRVPEQLPAQQPAAPSKPIVEPTAPPSAGRPISEPSAAPSSGGPERQDFWDKFPRGELICFQNGKQTATDTSAEQEPAKPTNDESNASWGKVPNGDFISFDDASGPKDKGPKPGGQVKLKKRVPESSKKSETKEDWDKRNSGDFISF